jgi:ribosomal protein S18 acetylase RimI-like enzyme
VVNINSKAEKTLQLKPVTSDDKNWINELIIKEWGSRIIVTRGKVHFVEDLQGFIAYEKNERVGLLLYEIFKGECEIISISSLKESIGIGSILLKEIERTATLKECSRIWLITTNDNTRAIRFYQKKGFNIRAIYPNSIKNSRVLKPEIPILGEDGIVIRDEIELEKKL